MFDDKKLWNARAGARLKDLNRYVKYIFNGHLVIVLLFLIGSAAFYYQKWVKTLSPDFPAEAILAVMIGLFLTYSPVYNFLLEADKVFLLALEDKLKGYFLRSGLASFVFQGYILLMAFAVLMPIYAQVSSTGFRLFLPYLFVLLVVKCWNLAVGWKINYFVQSSVHWWDSTVRYILNAVFTYLLLKQANIFILALLGLVMFLYYRYFLTHTKKMGLKWDRLISQEEKRMASFYRLANMFTDVPQLKETIKRRKWLDIFLLKINKIQKNTYLYLFARTFLRSSDYLGLFIRLTVIGGGAIYFLSFGLGQIFLSLVFLYLTGFQLLPLWKHHQNKIWGDLYPVAEMDKQASFHFLMTVILSSQVLIFALLVFMKREWTNGSLGLVAGLLFTYLFVRFYSKNRLRT